MTQDDLSFFPLRVTRVGVGGKRSSDSMDKGRLVEACLLPGASLSGLALKAGVNANQPRKWVRLHRQAELPREQQRHGRFSVGVCAGRCDRQSRAGACFDAVCTRAATTSVVASVFALADISMAVGPVAQWRKAGA